MDVDLESMGLRGLEARITEADKSIECYKICAHVCVCTYLSNVSHTKTKKILKYKNQKNIRMFNTVNV